MTIADEFRKLTDLADTRDERLARALEVEKLKREARDWARIALPCALESLKQTAKKGESRGIISGDKMGLPKRMRRAMPKNGLYFLGDELRRLGFKVEIERGEIVASW